MTLTKKWRSILVLDQNTQNLNISSLVLGSLGNLRVQACASLLEAENAGKIRGPDVMLIALNADHSGVQDAQYLHTKVYLKETPVIFFADELQRRSVGQLALPWVIGYIWAPYDPLLLAEQILDIAERCL